MTKIVHELYTKFFHQKLKHEIAVTHMKSSMSCYCAPHVAVL